MRGTRQLRIAAASLRPADDIVHSKVYHCGRPVESSRIGMEFKSFVT